ncbi:YceI family protein [Bdellovibrionota bacterium FG-1]
MFRCPFKIFAVGVVGLFFGFLPGSLVFGAPSPTPSTAVLSDMFWKIHVGGEGGKVGFKAIGKPSAIKIVGIGGTPQGDLLWSAAGWSGLISFKLETLDSGIGMRDRHMKERYLEIAKFPEAVLAIQKLDVTYEALRAKRNIEALPFQGSLKFHGVDHPVQGKLTISMNEAQPQVHADFTLLVTDYQINLPTFAGITMANEVEVSVDAPVTLTPEGTH